MIPNIGIVLAQSITLGTVGTIITIVLGLIALVGFGAGLYAYAKSTVDKKVSNSWKEYAETQEKENARLDKMLRETKAECSQRITDLEATVKVLRAEYSGAAAVQLVGEKLTGDVAGLHKKIDTEVIPRLKSLNGDGQ